MFKDDQGFLWVGNANGSELSRFDGGNFKKYIAYKDKPGTINSNKIYAFEEDSLHNIWIGTGRGISRYDSKADTFTNFPPFIDSIISNSDIIPFWATRDEVFCIEPESLITAFNIHTLGRRKLVQLSREPGFLFSWNTNKSFFDAASNSIWRLGFFKGDSSALQQIFLDGKTQFYSWPCYRSGVKHRHSAEDMRYDANRHSIWINSGDGLLEFSLNNKQFRAINAVNDLAKSKSFDRYVGIDIDKEGRIWFAINPKGILVYDPKKEELRPVFADSLLQQAAGQNNLHIYCDRDGIVWTSFYVDNGVYELLPYNTPFKKYVSNANISHSLSNNKIMTIVAGSQGRLWLGTDDGLNIFDPITEEFEVLRPKDLQGVRGHALIPIYIDTIHQKAWLTTNTALYSPFYAGDIYLMDIRTRKCSPMVFLDGTKMLDTLLIMPTYSVPYKNGFLIEDDSHGVFEIKGDTPLANLVIRFKKREHISHTAISQNRFLFLKNNDQSGIYPLNFTFENQNGKWNRISSPLDSIEWFSILYIEKDQSYWVSLENEIVHYDIDFRKLHSYNQQDGYPGKYTFNLLADHAGNIWSNNIASQITRLNTSTGIFYTLSEADGYQQQPYEWGPAAVDGGGNLYFGIGWNAGNAKSNWGLDRIYPERFASENNIQVYLQTLAINQQPFPLSAGLNRLQELTLGHDENNIKIEAGIIDFYAKGKGKIRYKLEADGKAADWQYPQDHAIRLDGLPPAAYRLVMQASTYGNEFNSPKKVLNFVINPPFWQTWWFMILAAITLFGSVYAIIQYRSRSLKQQNIQLEQKVALRTSELKLSLENLKETQTHLIQQEKMASLGELTAGIAHEIQNPLNFVNNFSEVNREMLEEMKSEIDKGNMEEVKAIAGDLIVNEEKIIYHGKRADSIVKGMLQHSRASSGIKEPTDINALADEYLRLSYHGLRAKDKLFNAKIETDFDIQLGKVNIISQDIGRVLLNIFNNAFYSVNEKKKKEGESFEPKVSVKTSVETGRAITRIRDNGLGIPKKVIDKIYQPFFTTKPTGEGTGLGLSLSYDIITKLHGGELKVETKEGEYAEFLIVLPLDNGQH